jgi:2-oxoisovalerate dehydrogenase E1 component
MTLSRELDERIWLLGRQGKVHLVNTPTGHEAAQAGSVLAMQPGVDYACPYYRDMCMALAWGMSPYEILLAAMGKPDDPCSGGIMMMGHYSRRDLNLVAGSSCVTSQILHAVGIAYGFKMRPTEAAVITYLGEGACSEGDFHEALNLASIHDLPVIFFVENNQYAISVPTYLQYGGPDIASRAAGYSMPGVVVDGNDLLAVYEATREARQRAIEGRGPTLIEAVVYRLSPHSNADRDSLYRSEDEVEYWRQRDPLKRIRDYLLTNGLATEAELESIQADARAEVDQASEAAWISREPDPTELYRHVYFEGQPQEAVGPAGQQRQMTFLEAVNDALHVAMERDDSVFVLGEDVGKKGGVFLVTEGLQQRFGTLRALDTPIAESSIVGASMGAAMVGFKPVAEIQFADYIHPAVNQIINEAAKLRYRSRSAWTAPIVVRAPFGAGIHGALYHSQSTEALFASTPGLKVVIPSTPYDAKGLLLAAIDDPDPVLYFEHKKLYRSARGDVPEGFYTVRLGSAEVKRSGADLTVVAYGLMLHYALEAAERLAQEGVAVEVVDLRTVYPFDRATVLDSVRKTGKALIVHEDNLTGGLGAEVAAVICEHAFNYLDAPVRRLCSPDVPAVAFNEILEDEFMLNPDKIEAAIRDLAAY